MVERSNFLVLIDKFEASILISNSWMNSSPTNSWITSIDLNNCSSLFPYIVISSIIYSTLFFNLTLDVIQALSYWITVFSLQFRFHTEGQKFYSILIKKTKITYLCPQSNTNGLSTLYIQQSFKVEK